MARIFQQNRNWAGEHGREKGAAQGEQARTTTSLSSDDMYLSALRQTGVYDITKRSEQESPSKASESAVEKGVESLRLSFELVVPRSLIP